LLRIQKVMPALYVVATPIGNLEDITFRALRILKEVRLIAAEDTRHTRQLLTRYDIKTRLTSYHQHNRLSKLKYVLDCLEEGDVALVSDAGMPGISDPGHELILAAIEKGIPVIPVPGPSAIITALVVSGLPSDDFHYVGFLPNRSNARKQFLETIRDESATIIALESPHRLLAALDDVLKVLGDRRLAVCRELTKIHEEIFRGRVSEAVAHFLEPRGEVVLVVEGKRAEGKPPMTGEVEEKLRKMRRSGETAKKAISVVARETGLSRKELYQTWIKLSGSAS
jgi:16S rRNA (cytidine1402-2'-O)-methyltransferase